MDDMNTVASLSGPGWRVTRKARLRPSWFSWTVAFAISLSLALVGIEVWQMWNMRDATLRNAKIVTEGLAQSVALQAENTLKTADTVVASIAQRVEVEGVGPEALERLYGLMTSLARALPAIHEMGITDSEGNAVVKSRVRNPAGMNYRDRDYFRFLSANKTRDVFVGLPVKSKVDGSLNSVSMDFFRNMFEAVGAKSGGHIGLVAANGTVLARSSQAFADGELQALSQSPGAKLEYTSPTDGVRRVGASSPLATYPMTVAVVEDSKAVLGDWLWRVRAHAVVLFFVLGTIAILGYRADQASRATAMQALRDGLTGLANRRYLNDAMEQEFARAARHRRPLSYIMLDIDLFKNFNDTYGHPAGDACLSAVANAVQGVLTRAGDLAARYGGEEIAILLPETNVAGATRIAQEVQAAVASLRMPHCGSPHGVVTVSAGVATCSDARQLASAQALVKRADEALYAAKASGRNTFAVRLSG
jgi:diguanylate cyclase